MRHGTSKWNVICYNESGIDYIWMVFCKINNFLLIRVKIITTQWLSNNVSFNVMKCYDGNTETLWAEVEKSVKCIY